MIRRLFALALFLVVPSMTLLADGKDELSVLLLGDSRGHKPLARSKQLIPVLATRGIQITYTESLDDLNPETLASYDCLAIYANHPEITADQEKALLDYVAGGKGFVPIHCASYCFLNSPKYIALVGAQFKSHGGEIFETEIVKCDHPVMKRFEGFMTWDETYVHTKHNKERTLLQVRRKGDHVEPWTWTRRHGKGRVFYTAYGHDHRTWGHPGFHELIERGIRWASGDDSVVESSVVKEENLPAFEYVKEKVPFYSPDHKEGPRGADGWDTMQLPLSPAESRKHLQYPRGFKVELFASEPDIRKPVCMNWDDRGRLWIAETVDYPNELMPEGEGHDDIKILEDTDGDGRADKFTVFAEKLSIPTGILFYKGGVIVHHGPETIYLKDTDGDDRADLKKVLIEGWGTYDTHAGPSNLHWGFDNWVWGMVGYSGFKGEVAGERHEFRMGFYRFRPDGSKFEFLRSTNNNTWGLGFSEEGVVFGSTANRNASVYMPIPNRYYERVRGWSAKRLETIAAAQDFYPVTDRVRQVDAHGLFTAGAGHALYTARSYPEYYWNRTAFVNGPTGHLTGTFLIEAVGADYVSRNSWNLLASDDEWTAPIIAEVGPDGQVWIVDWYNYIIQHNPTPYGWEKGERGAYVTHLRDKKHGRIYRVVHEDSHPGALRRIDNATTNQLVATLRDDNLFWRIRAQRRLIETKQRHAIPALIRLASDSSVDEIGLNTGVIHALWTLHGLGALDGSNARATEVAIRSLKHRSAGVRRNAVQVVPRNTDTLGALLEADLLGDENAQVRLMTLLALSEMPHSRGAARAIAVALSDPQNATDAWIPDAMTSAASAHDLDFLKIIARSTLSPSTRESARAVVSRVAEHYARGQARDTVESVIHVLVGADPAITEAAVSGLARGWPKESRPELSDDLSGSIAALFPGLSIEAEAGLLRLGGLWGVDRLEGRIQKVAAKLLESTTDEKRDEEDRLRSAQELVLLQQRDPETVGSLLAAISPRSSPAFASGVLDAVAMSEAPEAGVAIVDGLATLTPASKRRALGILLSRAVWTTSLLDAIDEGSVRTSDLELDQRRGLAEYPDAAIVARARKILERGDSLPNPDRQKVIEDFLPLIAGQAGNASLGKELFKKECSKCHMYKGEGTTIGPDLTGMAAQSKKELLVRMLDPNRSVEGNFRLYTAVLKDGRVVSGLLASESRTAIEIYDVEGKKHVVLREDINGALNASTMSVMPEGFEKQLGEDGVPHVIAYLKQHDRYLPLPLRKVATGMTTRGLFTDVDNRDERLIFKNWSPKTFRDVPFQLVDPRGARVANAIVLRGEQGKLSRSMPSSVSVPCNVSTKAIHVLGGIACGASQHKGRYGVSMIVKIHYEDGGKEEHELVNGTHIADYSGLYDVPESTLAFTLQSKRQVRYLAIQPKRNAPLSEIEFAAGTDGTSPVVMAVTVETSN